MTPAVTDGDPEHPLFTARALRAHAEGEIYGRPILLPGIVGRRLSILAALVVLVVAVDAALGGPVWPSLLRAFESITT